MSVINSKLLCLPMFVHITPGSLWYISVFQYFSIAFGGISISQATRSGCSTQFIYDDLPPLNEYISILIQCSRQIPLLNWIFFFFLLVSQWIYFPPFDFVEMPILYVYIACDTALVCTLQEYTSCQLLFGRFLESIILFPSVLSDL